MSKKAKPEMTRRQKRWRNGRLGAIFGFTLMYIKGFSGSLEGFSKGWRVLEHVGGLNIKLFEHGEQVPLIWLFIGSYGYVLMLSLLLGTLCFCCFFAINPDQIDEVIENYKRQQKK